MQKFDVNYFRSLFPAFFEQSAGNKIFLDAVGGTQVPQTVIDAVVDWYRTKNGNKGGVFRRSKDTDDLMDETRALLADFINAPSPNEIIFGPNFTSLTFHMSRSLARLWQPGDEIILSRLDHDANISPWLLAAEDRGVRVNFIDIEDSNCQLKYEEYQSLLSEKTRLVAFCAASSSVGTRPDVKKIISAARTVGAVTYVDAVAYAPHLPIDVQEWGADFVGCSAYKFFGPHIGILWGKRELLESLPAYKIRPAPNNLPLKWLNGAQAYELVAGTHAAISYLAHVGEKVTQNIGITNQQTPKVYIRAGMNAIADYEQSLTWYLINEMKKNKKYTLWGVIDEKENQSRVPTVAFSIPGVYATELAVYLANHDIDVWSRSVYSVSVSERLGLQDLGGFIRLGLVHYNTKVELDTTLSVLDAYRKGSV